ncbi:MAG: cold-shock protein [Pelagibacteraceae bacterium]|nr:cold-shock protein [Pelagibacteraceae bacterium]
MSSKTGTVKWFNPKKGYGFISQDDTPDKDMFLHITALQKANISVLNEGDKISYDVEEENGRQSAVNIKQI